MTYDLLIKNGRIIDGSGTGSFIGDVAVQDGKIALVGRADGGAKRTIGGAIERQPTTLANTMSRTRTCLRMMGPASDSSVNPCR